MTDLKIVKVCAVAALLMLSGCMDGNAQKVMLESAIKACESRGQSSRVFANAARLEVECIAKVSHE
jgi:hypothetical protein